MYVLLQAKFYKISRAQKLGDILNKNDKLKVMLFCTEEESDDRLWKSFLESD